jgi:hypothetical protein
MELKNGIEMVKKRDNDLPAVIGANGDQFCFVNGKQKRL